MSLSIKNYVGPNQIVWSSDVIQKQMIIAKCNVPVILLCALKQLRRRSKIGGSVDATKHRKALKGYMLCLSAVRSNSS